MTFYHLNMFYWSQLRSSWSPHVFSGFLLRDMGLFVLQCKHAQDDSSNPGNLIESSWAFNLIFWWDSKLGYKWSQVAPYWRTIEIKVIWLHKWSWLAIIGPDLIGRNWPVSNFAPERSRALILGSYWPQTVSQMIVEFNLVFRHPNWPWLANYLDFDQYLKFGQLSSFWPIMGN